MSRPIALLASGLFTILVVAVMTFVIWSLRAAPATNVPVATDAATSTAAEQQLQEAQQTLYQARIQQAEAGMAAREAQYRARLAELSQLAQQRDTEYKARLTEAGTQVAAYQAQVDQVRQSALTYQGEATKLQEALNQRQALFETRRQEFEAQRTQRLAQLQAQLDEGKAKLQEANAQLGR
jgi:chromosome segregation ATPase